jgi:dephospho-CoA kinase
MKTIGLVGGVASGKSLATNMLAELGAVRFDADAAAHDVLNHNAAIRTELLHRWGEDIFNNDGSVNRSAVAKRVFAPGNEAAGERKFLENLLHPRVQDECKGWMNAAASNGRPAFVVDAPLLLEAGWGPMCDLVLMIDSPRELRLGRAKARGWSEAEFDRREAAQWPPNEKSRLADVVIPNQGTDEELRSAIADFWHREIKPVQRP